MTIEINKPDTTKFFVIKCGDIVHYGQVDDNQQMTSGMGSDPACEGLETFDDEQLYINRLDELGISLSSNELETL